MTQAQENRNASRTPTGQDPAPVAEQASDLIDELDELLDEIDTVLEENMWVEHFVQKGGE